MLKTPILGLLNATEKLEASANTALKAETLKGENARKRREYYRRLIRLCWALETRLASSLHEAGAKGKT